MNNNKKNINISAYNLNEYTEERLQKALSKLHNIKTNISFHSTIYNGTHSVHEEALIIARNLREAERSDASIFYINDAIARSLSTGIVLNQVVYWSPVTVLILDMEFSLEYYIAKYVAAFNQNAIVVESEPEAVEVFVAAIGAAYTDS